MTRRRLFATLPAAALPFAVATPPPPSAPAVPVPDLDADDPLIRLAAHYGAAVARYVRRNDECERIFEADPASYDAFESEHVAPAEREAAAADHALSSAMLDRDTPIVVAGNTLFVSTCFGPDVPEPLIYVMTFDLAELAGAAPAHDPLGDLSDTWFFNASQLVASTDSEAEDPRSPLMVEFELHGDQAAAVRAWLDRNTHSINDMDEMDDSEEGGES